MSDPNWIEEIIKILPPQFEVYHEPKINKINIIWKDRSRIVFGAPIEFLEIVGEDKILELIETWTTAAAELHRRHGDPWRHL